MKKNTPLPVLRLAGATTGEKFEKQQRKVPRSRLINLLNRINFRDGDITVLFKHKKYNHIMAVQAKPQICNDDYLRCLWSKHFDAARQLKQYQFLDFTFSSGLNQVRVAAKLIEMNNNGVYLELPDTSFEMKNREIRRHKCSGISAQLVQDGKIIRGNLESFSAQAFGLVFPPSAGPDILLNEKNPVNIVLENDREFIFTCTCEIIRQHTSSSKNYLVAKPTKYNIQLFKQKDVRSERLVLNPLPSIFFRHPLTGLKCHLPLLNISGTGFAVAEDPNHAVLMPGLVLPKVELEFIHGFSLPCRAQVVYSMEEDGYVKCGIAILDMDMADHVRLSSYLHQARNIHSTISTSNIDLDELWDFFFESGFVYPEKYSHIGDQKDRFKLLYRKLYHECPEIARHVIYQDKGRIYGHVSMFRYYRNTWLLHHHAAIKSARHKAGLIVMEQILQYINECHTLPSARMQYIACYFRPGNKFAGKVFGGAARALMDPKKCSLDDFAYYHFEPDPDPQPLAAGYALDSTQPEDLEIFYHWYEKHSGGLMIEGMDLTPEAGQLDENTCREYQRLGFRRSRKLFCLKKNDELAILFIVNRSDLGMNMSDLTNCLQIFIIEEHLVNPELIRQSLCHLAEYFEMNEIPVLLYPESFAGENNIAYDKTYVLTVLNLDYISPYLKFMQSLTEPGSKKRAASLKNSLRSTND